MTIALNQCLCGDALAILPDLVAAGVRVNCVVTSPPYWGLRDYGVAGQIGLEATPQEYVAGLAKVFGLVRDLLADDGTLWLNLGDSYTYHQGQRKTTDQAGGKQASNAASMDVPSRHVPAIAPKNLVGIPWRVAFALQDAGWNLRSEIIWSKPNPMPEPVKDRPTKAHEQIFLFAKSHQYFYDYEAVKEPAICRSIKKFIDNGYDKQRGHSRRHAGFNGRYAKKIIAEGPPQKRNLRDVWEISPQPFAEAHFAVFPEELARRCILAGSREGDVVLDPFMGAGTVAVVAEKMGRRWLGIELNPDYLELQNRRLAKVTPLLKAAGI